MLPVTFLSPASAATSVSVRPLPLPLGEPPTVPYIAGADGDSDVVAGTTRVAIPTNEFDTAGLVGVAGTGYLVRIFAGDRVPDRVVRVEPGKAPKQFAELEYYEASRLSTNGRYLLVSGYPSTAVVRVLDAVTGHQVARHSFRTSTEPLPLDVRGTKIVIGGWSPARTMVWDWSTGAVSTIANRSAYEASYATNKLASYTRRPSDADACSVVSSLTSPGATSWRTCTEKVAAFSPDGARVATEPIEHQDVAYFVKRRSINGTLLTTYTNPNGVWTGAWETNTRSLLESYPTDGPGWLVRCEASTCERAAKGRIGQP